MKYKSYSFLFFVTLFSACVLFSRKEKKEEKQVIVKKEVDKKQADSVAYQSTVVKANDSVVTIRISAVGDLMSHSPQVQNARIADDKYDFAPSFAEVKKYLSAADFTFGNFETTCGGKEKGYKGYPAFNTPDDFVIAIKDAGFDLLATSNNHSMDTEEEGLQRTIDVIKKNNIGYTGTFQSQQDRDSVRIFNIKGIQLGILNYTYGTNALYPIPEHKYMLNVIDTLQIEKDIALARKQGSEVVLVFFHYGIENKSEPTEEQKNIIAKTAGYGADIIIGAHPHVISPANFFKTNNAKLDTGFIAYSLGNFLSNQYWRYADAGVIVNMNLTKNFTKNKIYISSVDFLPTWVYRGTNPAKKMHIIYPAQLCEQDSIPAFIDNELKNKMKEAYEDTRQMMTRYTTKIKLYDIKKK